VIVDTPTGRPDHRCIADDAPRGCHLVRGEHALRQQGPREQRAWKCLQCQSGKNTGFILNGVRIKKSKYYYNTNYGYGYRYAYGYGTGYGYGYGDLASRVQVVGAALGDTEGSFTFNASGNVDDQTSSGGYLDTVSPPLEAAIYERSHFNSFQVTVHRLDDLVVKHGWGRVAFIKLDVEGAEQLVLRGAVELLKRDRPVLCIEVHSVNCMLETHAVLAPLGYTIRMLKEDRPSRAHVICHGPETSLG
jgi:FkbM family methyltransferase